jgi:hypothetical protein
MLLMEMVNLNTGGIVHYQTVLKEELQSDPGNRFRYSGRSCPVYPLPEAPASTQRKERNLSPESNAIFFKIIGKNQRSGGGQQGTNGQFFSLGSMSASFTTREKRSPYTINFIIVAKLKHFSCLKFDI